MYTCKSFLLLLLTQSGKTSGDESHPVSYYLQYTGDDELVRQLFLKENLEGYFNEENSFTTNGVPVWVKQEPSQLYLYRNDVNQWTISKYLTDPYGIIYSEAKKGESFPSGKNNWKVKRGRNQWITVEGIIITHTEDQENKEKSYKIMLVLIILIVVVVVVVGGLVVYLLWTKIRPKEEPVMEKNPDYNDDEEYYDEHDNRVVDNNEYYQ